MTQKQWMEEGFDLQLAWILFWKKIWIPIISIVVGAALCGGIYFFTHVIYAPAREYEAVSKLYLTFAMKTEEDAYQYYNGYTWNDLMGTEPIMDKIMEKATGIDRSEIRSKISADILSDIRLLTVTVRTNDPELTNVLIRAAEDAVVRFGEEIPEFEKIEVIEHGEAKLVIVENETLRAVVFGGVLGFFLAFFGMLLVRVLDTSIYVPSDFEKRYPYPVLGVIMRGEQKEAEQKELEENVAYVSQDADEVVYLDVMPDRAADYPLIRKNGGVILRIPYGKKNGKLVEAVISKLKTQDCKIFGAIITDADETLYRMYYIGSKKKSKKSMETF